MAALSQHRTKRIRQTENLLRCCLLLAVLLILPDFIAGLKDVSVTIPQAVKRGSNALLICNYDMENDTLYSVKWYKGRREFYRYTPKENPAMKVFAMTSGLNVERNLSNQSHVVLLAVPLTISGKFTCEISVDAPSFLTAMVSGEMEVVELPEQQASVTGIQPRYRIGDLVDGNCSIKFSKPAANLTWTINGIVVPPHHIKTYQIEKYDESNLESVISAIHFMVTTQHFQKGQMRLKCTASIFDIFKEEIESIIEEDRPRIMASGRSYDMNNYPYEQHPNSDGLEDHNESFLTYLSGDVKSSASRNSAIFMEPLKKNLKQMGKNFYFFSRIQSKIILYSKILQKNIQLNVQNLLIHIQWEFENFNGKWHLSSNSENDVRQIREQQKDKGNIFTLFAECVGGIFLTAMITTKIIVHVAIILTHQLMSCQNSTTSIAGAGVNVEIDKEEIEEAQVNESKIKKKSTKITSAAITSAIYELKALLNETLSKAALIEPEVAITAASITSKAIIIKLKKIKSISLKSATNSQQQRTILTKCQKENPNGVNTNTMEIVVTKHDDSDNSSSTCTILTTKNVATVACQQLSVTDAAKDAAFANEYNDATAATDKASIAIECNFVKNLPKDQILLMIAFLRHFDFVINENMTFDCKTPMLMLLNQTQTQIQIQIQIQKQLLKQKENQNQMQNQMQKQMQKQKNNHQCNWSCCRCDSCCCCC